MIEISDMFFINPHILQMKTQGQSERVFKALHRQLHCPLCKLTFHKSFGFRRHMARVHKKFILLKHVSGVEEQPRRPKSKILDQEIDKSQHTEILPEQETTRILTDQSSSPSDKANQNPHLHEESILPIKEDSLPNLPSIVQKHASTLPSQTSTIPERVDTLSIEGSISPEEPSVLSKPTRLLPDQVNLLLNQASTLLKEKSILLDQPSVLQSQISNLPNEESILPDIENILPVDDSILPDVPNALTNHLKSPLDVETILPEYKKYSDDVKKVCERINQSYSSGKGLQKLTKQSNRLQKQSIVSLKQSNSWPSKARRPSRVGRYLSKASKCSSTTNQKSSNTTEFFYPESAAFLSPKRISPQLIITPSNPNKLSSQTMLHPPQFSMPSSQASALSSKSSKLPNYLNELPKFNELPTQATELPNQGSALQSHSSVLPFQAGVIQSQASVLLSQTSVLPFQTSVIQSQTSTFSSPKNVVPSQLSVLSSQSSPFSSQVSELAMRGGTRFSEINVGQVTISEPIILSSSEDSDFEIVTTETVEFEMEEEIIIDMEEPIAKRKRMEVRHASPVPEETPFEFLDCAPEVITLEEKDATANCVTEQDFEELEDSISILS